MGAICPHDSTVEIFASVRLRAMDNRIAVALFAAFNIINLPAVSKHIVRKRNPAGVSYFFISGSIRGEGVREFRDSCLYQGRF
jgi:hypothetical protein